MKGTARKVRRIYNGEVVVDLLEVWQMLSHWKKIWRETQWIQRQLYNVLLLELAQWRTQQSMQKLEAMLIVMNQEEMLLFLGQEKSFHQMKDFAIGSGQYALAAARAMKTLRRWSSSKKKLAEGALNIAADICVFIQSQHYVSSFKEDEAMTNQTSYHQKTSSKELINFYIDCQNCTHYRKSDCSSFTCNRYHRISKLDEKMQQDVTPTAIF